MSFALAGGLFTTEPPAKPKEIFLGTIDFAVDFSFPFFFKLGKKKRKQRNNKSSSYNTPTKCSRILMTPTCRPV